MWTEVDYHVDRCVQMLWTELDSHCGLTWPPKLDGRGLPCGGEIGRPSGQDVVGPKARCWTSMKA